MNLSPEKLKLFERLYDEFWQASLREESYRPPELDTEDKVQEYLEWRFYNKDIPFMQEGKQDFLEYLATQKHWTEREEGNHSETNEEV